MSHLGQAQFPWPKAVADYQFGPLQNVGQGPEHFPANVLGPLTPPVSPTQPAASPAQVVSLGRGGYLVLEFDPPIADGPGPDFTVFENVILVEGPTPTYFDEWMVVAVSMDAATWTEFAHDTLTGHGMAGRTPTATYGTDYQNPALSGGDTFDLGTLGLAQARFVRLADATRHQHSALRLAADVDGIVALHPDATVGTAANLQAMGIRAWPAEGLLAVENQEYIREIRLVDLAGQSVWGAGPIAAGAHRLALPELPAGIYFLTALGANQAAASTKIILPAR